MKKKINKIEIDIPKRMSMDEKFDWFQDTVNSKQVGYFNMTLDEFKEIQKKNINWDNEYRLTQEQYFEVEDFALSLMSKLFRWNQTKCRKEWIWFSLDNMLSVNYDRIQDKSR